MNSSVTLMTSPILYNLNYISLRQCVRDREDKVRGTLSALLSI
ncbi:1107_t:CDS:2 [Funneliformis mosseae]|uniref:1107_t:CDS:1 n=1 Tax=Funneliformis mosseae TaxID=27381 RepID=A0A9N9FLM0_FUNMO|nr:1107_t:CDS:2 [Funneliformis mosseae]